jgi:DNA mismatch repair ATPase MutS
MLARCGPALRRGRASLRSQEFRLSYCSPYHSSPSQSKAGPSSKKQRQSTINWDDLPLRASDGTGEPSEALPPFQSGRQSPGNGKSKGKGKEKAEDGTAEEADEFPRVNELGPQGQEWPPLAKDVLRNLGRFPSCILLTRVGGFYESYFEQAPLLANLLGIKLANRSWGGRNVPMAGFPIFQVEKYLKILVMDHRRLVAICDEFKEIEQTTSQSQRIAGKAAFNETVNIKRRVTRVVSPGTLIDEHFLDPFSSNWVLSISKVGSRYGLAWLDVSTADFFTTSCEDEHGLRDEVARIGPTEVVLERGAFGHHSEESRLGDAVVVDPDGNALWEVLDPAKTHISLCPAGAPALSGATLEDAEDIAVANLTAHIRTRLLEQDIHNVEDLTGETVGPMRRRREQVMLIDANTLIALEINASLRRQETAYNTNSTIPSVRGSLLSNIRRTVTKGGARLLAQWLTAPSTSLAVIHRRQALVALFHSHPFFMEDLRLLLRRGAGDINRALQRIITSRNDVQDLLEVRDFTKLCHSLIEVLENEIRRVSEGESTEDQDGWAAIQSMVEVFSPLHQLSERLGEAIDENVIERRTQVQADQEREVEMQVLSEGGNMASGERSRKQSDWRRQGGESDDETLWGAPFDHLIRPR